MQGIQSSAHAALSQLLTSSNDMYTNFGNTYVEAQESTKFIEEAKEGQVIIIPDKNVYIDKKLLENKLKNTNFLIIYDDIWLRRPLVEENYFILKKHVKK
jgi:hypothetical protein